MNRNVKEILREAAIMAVCCTILASAWHAAEAGELETIPQPSQSTLNDVPVMVGVILASYHWDRTTKYNEANPGMYVSVGHIEAYGFKNSYGDMTFALGGTVSKTLWRSGKWAFKGSLGAGVNYGYGEKYGPAEGSPTVNPYLTPTASLSRGATSVNISILGDQAIGLSVLWRLQ